jgi:CubicO group peptidase (beta-lactamase class C family)
MDVPGKADALGMGWVYMAPKNGRPGIIQKTGGGGGFITYMAMIPQSNVGAFVVVTRSPHTRFVNMSDGVNNLVAELSANKAGAYRIQLRLIFRGQAVDADQLAPAHIDIISLSQGGQNLGNNRT